MAHRNVINSFFTNDRVMLSLVVVNTITIFIGGYFNASRFFVWTDAFFTLLFLAEVIVKVKYFGWADYWKDGWNKFDFIITLIAIPSLMNLFVETGVATNILLSLRTLRVFKSFRLLKFIPNINGLLKGIGVAIKTSFIVCVAFAIMLLIIAILSTTLYGKIAPDLFGDPGLSLFTIFRLFTGDGWSEIPTQIAEHNSEFVGRTTRVVFAVLFFVGGILGLSLVNSIFVDALAGDNNDNVLQRLDELEKNNKSLNEETIKKLFSRLDEMEKEITEQ